MTQARPWRPLLAPALAREALEGILTTLPAPEDPACGPSLAGGHAGFALVFAYAGLAAAGGRREAFHHRARAHLEAAADLNAADGPGLFAGWTGVAWTVDHLQRLGLLEAGEDLNVDLDEALLALLEPGAWRGLPELIDGLAGIGLYALDRPEAPRARRIITRVLALLQATAVATPSGLAWPEPEGGFNLGVAHGHSGVIGLLAEATPRGFAVAAALLEPALAWLLSCKAHHPDGSIFGRAFEPNRPADPEGCRLSWCYGDLGIAPVLMLAALRTGRRAWREEAVQLALACAARPEPWAGVRDAGLCHGAAGNAHLCNRLYQATGLAPLKACARAWYEGVLALRQKETACGGYRAFTGTLDARQPWTPVPGLLMGSAGIALSLLAATTGVEPAWDRPLLAHLPPRRSSWGSSAGHGSARPAPRWR